MPPKPEGPTVLYVAGYGRSGTTILDMLLNVQPSMFGAGELTNLFETWIHDKQCSCSQPYSRCSFWLQVKDYFSKRLPGVTWEQALYTTRSLDASFNLYPRRFATGLRRDYRQIWRTIADGITAVAESDVIVDSSKSTRFNGGRILALSKICELNVKVIHLVRDPRATMWSSLRGSNRQLESGRGRAAPDNRHGGVVRTLAAWSLANLTVHAIEHTHAFPVERVTYEALVTDPVSEVNRLANALELDMGSVISHLESNAVIPPGHGVAGNRLRREGGQRLQADDEWNTQLPSYARGVSVLSWPLARIYGYNFGQHNRRLPARTDRPQS